MSDPGKRFLIFALDGQRYTVNVADISEIMEPPQLFPIPKAPKNYLGIFNFHGSPIPLLDLAAFLCGNTPGTSGKILVLNSGIGSLAFRIDAVERIVSDIRGLKSIQEEGPYTHRSILFNNEKIPLLAVDELLTELENDLRNGDRVTATGKEMTRKRRNI